MRWLASLLLALFATAAQAQTDSFLALNGTFKNPFSLANTWTGQQTFNTNGLIINPTAGSTNQALNITQSGPTSGTVSCSPTSDNSCVHFNSIAVTGDAFNIPNTYGAVGLNIDYGFGGVNLEGYRIGLNVNLHQNNAGNGSNANPFYTAGNFVFQGFTTDTATTAGTGLNVFSQLNVGATGWHSLQGLEIDTGMLSSGGAAFRVALNPAGIGNFQGASGDYAIAIGATAGAPWLRGIEFSRFNVGPALDPTNGCAICTDGADTIKTAVSFKTYTVSGNAWEGPNLNSVISGTGQLSLGLNGGTIGQVTLNGSTSGAAIIKPQAVAGTPTLTLGTSSGTPVVTSSGPLAITAATGNLTCTTCATTTSGGALSATAPVALSAGGAISITGAAGQVLAGAGPAFTATPTLGVNGGTGGQLTFNGSTSGSVVVNPSVTAGQLNFNQPIASGVAGGTGGALLLNGSTSGTATLSVTASTGTLLLSSGLTSGTVTDLFISDTVSGNSVRETIQNNSAANFAGAQISLQTGATSTDMLFQLSNGSAAPIGSLFWDTGVTGGFQFSKAGTVVATVNSGWQIGTTVTGGDEGIGTMNVQGAYYQAGTIGVTCSGTPTASFASKLGIVTHC